ncbi:MAG: hypothetical protein J2P58_02480 [Acidimicrobiaceae bacterium]|nr:hypothetical protein [Acidimicrobiaceae bacterium]
MTPPEPTTPLSFRKPEAKSDPPDAEAPDAGRSDAGRSDAATSDIGTSHTRTPDARSAPHLASLDRILALTDQVIGLQAELAEERYRHDLTETVLTSIEESRPSPYAADGTAADLVLHARLSTEIELRQGLTRRLAEERARAEEAERQVAQLRSSLQWRAEHAARAAANAARKLWH